MKENNVDYMDVKVVASLWNRICVAFRLVFLSKITIGVREE